MMMRTLIAAAACALAACTPEQLVISTPPEPIPVAVAAECFAACAPLPAWRTAPDGTAAWHELGALAIADSERLTACDTRRAHCAAALKRLEDARVIVVRSKPGR